MGTSTLLYKNKKEEKINQWKIVQKYGILYNVLNFLFFGFLFQLKKPPIQILTL
jgi:hypothetical protein